MISDVTARPSQVAAPGSSAGERPPAGAAAGPGTRPKAEDRFEGQKLDAGELALISQLAARDREVRAHEAAHQGAGGGLVGAASYSYQTGPDGRQYAIGGEVPVHLSSASGDPAATIARMRQVQAAALAPGDPSSQDLAVAASARAIAAAAQADLSQQRQQEQAERQSPRQREALAAYAKAEATDPGAAVTITRASSPAP